MIPGSHNAGSYEIGYRRRSANTLKKYAICHEESVYNQLVFGIRRYLDIRVSYEEVKDRNETLWIAHGVLRMDISLESVLQQVKQFIEATEKEIVILDFHRFEKGFEENNETILDELIARHQLVIDLTKKYLRKFLAHRSDGYDMTIGQLLQRNQRVIIGYDKYNLHGEQFLFPRIKHLWADTDNITRLEEYFNETLCKISSPEPQSAMAQLTPTPWGVLFDKYGSIRKMSKKVNPLISEWFRERWWGCANIVSIDFILSNSIIDTAIKSNRLRYSNDAKSVRKKLKQRSKS
ncbi:uncharacterized protein B4U79_03254 [Dinothrombium tinctorium]|uniref:PI-PLC X domain-containing protein 3-like protein n=2 Tax=Dinothrombium tinctorium TaxID=1965070 RepID=A0A3S3P7Y2_9ACAR|nr:uncharacterized protein B4U79_06236 [Dinothrombium tinctorium]RWS14104.1 uncharacterized protein B4U79_03254 [Dinothrombium tinctorium]